ncbi:MAG TPA: hypothetical protein VMW02_01800 [Thermoplasmata archaeon]|nr:hypothetical protein [Thermoplasmata archaeon]
MAVKKKIDELRSSEEKFQSIITKRDELNQQAQAIRVERDALNDKKRELRGYLDDFRDQRRSLSAKVGEHKKKRDDLQLKAKSMIAMKQKLRSGMNKEARMSLTEKKHEMHRLEMEQQTIPVPIEEETELVKKIKALYKQISELEGLVKKQKEIQLSVQEIDDTIDEAFALANSEHQHLMLHVNERKEIDSKINTIVNDIGIVIAAANKKHKEFLEVREAADAQHNKARELRDKILEIRATKRAERDEQRRAIADVNASVRKELLDKDKLDKAADSALKQLLSKGKIEL